MGRVVSCGRGREGGQEGTVEGFGRLAVLWIAQVFMFSLLISLHIYGILNFLVHMSYFVIKMAKTNVCILEFHLGIYWINVSLS